MNKTIKREERKEKLAHSHNIIYFHQSKYRKNKDPNAKEEREDKHRVYLIL